MSLPYQVCGLSWKGQNAYTGLERLGAGGSTSEMASSLPPWSLGRDDYKDGALVSQSCRNKEPQTGWLKQQKCIISQF